MLDKAHLATLILNLALAACTPMAPTDDSDDTDTIDDTDGTDVIDDCALPQPDVVSLDREVVITGAPSVDFGWFDPSFVYPNATGVGAMSYSAVDGAVGEHRLVHTRVAFSTDAGASWVHGVQLNTNSAVSIDCGRATCDGFLNHEVSSLVWDPDDKQGRRWKLFAATYFVDEAGEHYGRGFLSVFVADKPEGPWSGPDKAIGWISDTSLSSEGATTLLSDIDGMEGCVALTEPSATVRADGSLDLAVGCAFLPNNIRIERLRSQDHGAT